MEFIKKKFIFYFQLLCILAMFLFSGIFEKHINCSSSLSRNSNAFIRSSHKKTRYSKRFHRKKAKNSKLDWGSLFTVAKSVGTDFVKKLYESTKEKELYLFKGISSALGFIVTEDFSNCLKNDYGDIDAKVRPLIQSFEKFVKDIQNPSGHLTELTNVALLSRGVYDSISICNAKKESSSGLFSKIGQQALEAIKHAAIEKAHKYIEEQAKQKLPADIVEKIGNHGLISLSLAGEMSKHIQNFHIAKHGTPFDEEEKGKHLGLMIKAVIDNSKAKKRRRRYK